MNEKFPTAAVDRTKREKNRPDIVEEEGKIDGPRGVGNRESGSIVPAYPLRLMTAHSSLLSNSQKKRKIKMGGETFLLLEVSSGAHNFFSQTEMGAHDDG
jgi:hypothetical protein